MAFKKKFMAKSPLLNYKNPEDYEVFNMGNKPSAFQKETNYLDDKQNPPKKNSGGPKGKIGSEYRKKEYDERGWKYDDTIAGYNKDGSKKEDTKPSTKLEYKMPTVGGVGGKLGIIPKNQNKKTNVEPTKKKKTKVGKWLKKNFGKGRKVKLKGSGGNSDPFSKKKKY